MTPKDLLKFLKLIHRVFPLPSSPDFKGTHGIHLKNGLISVTIWHFNQQKEVVWTEILFSEHDSFGEASLQAVKNIIPNLCEFLEEPKTSKIMDA